MTLELKVPPVIQVIMIAMTMYVLSKIAVSLKFSLIGSTWLAAMFIVVGLSLGVLGVLQFKKAQTTVNPHDISKASHLVTSGIFQYTRNPMYLGLSLILLGWAFYLSHYLAFIVLPIFIIYMTRFQILPEERMMTSLFGNSYQHYKDKVRRWI